MLPKGLPSKKEVGYIEEDILMIWFNKLFLLNQRFQLQRKILSFEFFWLITIEFSILIQLLNIIFQRFTISKKLNNCRIL